MEPSIRNLCALVMIPGVIPNSPDRLSGTVPLDPLLYSFKSSPISIFVLLVSPISNSPMRPSRTEVLGSEVKLCEKTLSKETVVFIEDSSAA